MPRISDSAGDPIDFCSDCFPSEAEAEERFGDVGKAPDGRGNAFAYDPEHPDYDNEVYTCYECGVPLIADDNFAE